MIFGCLYSFITFWIFANAYSNIENPNEKHLIVAFVMWLIIGPGMVLFFHKVFNP